MQSIVHVLWDWDTAFCSSSNFHVHLLTHGSFLRISPGYCYDASFVTALWFPANGSDYIKLYTQGKKKLLLIKTLLVSKKFKINNPS